MKYLNNFRMRTFILELVVFQVLVELLFYKLQVLVIKNLASIACLQASVYF
jgi:hypothetical protein